MRILPSIARTRRYFMILMLFTVVSATIMLVMGHSRRRRLDEGNPRCNISSLVSPVISEDAPDALWQPVACTRHKFFVYSAYEETRSGRAIRVIGVTNTTSASAVWCRVYLANNETLTLRASSTPIRENENKNYSAYFILCPLKPHNEVSLKDARVAVVASPEAAATNILRVISTDRNKKVDGGNEMKITVCVQPLHFAYEHELWLMEWLELNSILGVHKFIMYIESVSEKVQCLLSHYEELGAVQLLPWKFKLLSPHEKHGEIWVHGQLAAFNDCLYRSMSSTDWLINNDVDEVVIPKKGMKNYTGLLSNLNGAAGAGAEKQKPAAYLFRDALFYTPWKDDPIAGQSTLITMRKTRRIPVPYEVRTKSKYFTRPADTVELGVHFVWEFIPGQVDVGVPQEVALLHHYRMGCGSDAKNCLKGNFSVDRTAHLFGEELETRVASRYAELKHKCQLPERNLMNIST